MNVLRQNGLGPFPNLIVVIVGVVELESAVDCLCHIVSQTRNDSKEQDAVV